MNAVSSEIAHFRGGMSGTTEHYLIKVHHMTLRQLPSETSSAPDSEPSKGAWYAVCLLLLLYILSYVGRQIITVLVDPIEKTLGLTDIQVGLLVGLAFTLVFAFCGILVGWLVDTFPRKIIIFVGTIIWSLSCIMCGLSTSFEWLFIARMGVGIGEATLMPSAYAFLSDVFPRRKLATALGIFSFGSTFGVALALGIGGYVLGFFSHSQGMQTPVGHLEPWQLAFVFSGVPALVLSALALTLPEQRKPKHTTERRALIKPLITLFRTHTWVMSAQFIGFAMNALMGYTLMAWAPAFMGRSYGWRPVEIGTALALVVGISGAVATLGSGFVADRLWSRGVQGSHYLLASLVLAISVPFGIIAFLSPYPWVFLLGASVVYFAAAVSLNMGATALQLLTPPPLRGRLSGLYLFWTNMFGACLGPLIVAILTQHLLEGRAKVGVAMAIVIPLAAMAGATMLCLARHRYADIVTAAEAKLDLAVTNSSPLGMKQALGDKVNGQLS